MSNIILSSSSAITSDAETFYKDYWLTATEGSAISEQVVQRTDFIIKKLLGDVAVGSNFLEIGVGGEGGIIATLRDSASVYGVDISDSAITACRSIGIPVSKINCNNQPLPFANSFFDVVIALEVFEHFANPQFALEEIRRVLKPKGVLVLSFPAAYTYHWPRLFYPELFTENNFRDFLLSNRFMPSLHKDPFFKNSYASHPVLSESDKSFSLYWQAIKIDDSDLQALYVLGKELFERKDRHGIRTRPIEALELLKQCMEIGEVTLELESDYLSALLYRVVNGDIKEFSARIFSILERLQTEDNKARYAASILAVHREAEQLGSSFLDAEVLEMLSAMAENP